MRECFYCKRPLREEDTICTFCGYDSKTDSVSPCFREKTASEDLRKKSKQKDKKGKFTIDPKIKKFAFIALIVVIFSIFYKYSFNLSPVVADVKLTFAKLKNIKIGKFIMGKPQKKKDKTGEKVQQWVDMSSFEGVKKAFRSKDLVVEGIFFDPNGKSFVTINGKVLSEGENFENILVKKINIDSAEVIVNGKIKIIEVKK
jgi:hypothetical protein